ncbi:MAG: TonB-dependent receptor [Bacteroidota bacterium]|nr:TonB-dependent receptor [Bacteroidota bacterium]
MFILFFGIVKAQNKDTILLPEVNVKSTKLNSSLTGKKIQKIDSLTLELFKNQTLDVLLSNNTPIFIKNYGPGALQTTTFRGGNASQTAILWNGLNIQNSMLGLTDISNISGSLFNSVEIEYGGSSALWGSGAMGGAVHLNNTHAFNKGVYTKLNTLISTIGSRSAFTDVGYSNSKISFALKASVIKNKNEYAFYNDSNVLVKRKDASYEQLSAMPELKWFINNHNTVQAGAWLTKGIRNIPNFSNIHNKIQQTDESERMNFNWYHSKNRITNNLKVAHFTERLDYLDSISRIDSRSTMQTRIIEDDLYFKWQSNHTLNIGFNYTKNEGLTEYYYGSKFIERYSFITSHRDVFFNSKLTTNAAIRAEHTSSNLNPITYNFGAEYVPFKKLLLKLNAGKVYRIPTLNDLYWTPGGNPSLKPEEGYTADGTAEYSTSNGAYNLLVSGSIFYKLISNWIQWVPYGVGYSQPVNLQEVYSRGAETSWQTGYTKDKFNIQLKCITSYVLSTISKTELEGDETLNKQLIYTPRYTINSSLTLIYKTFAISYFNNYIGYRFTASDNSVWLNPYHYSTLRAIYTNRFQKMELGFFGNINNVLNKQIEILANRPIALRYFEIGIQLNYKKT